MDYIQVRHVGILLKVWLTLSFSESIMKTCCVVLSFESVDKILEWDHLNETSGSTFAGCYLFLNT